MRYQSDKHFVYLIDPPFQRKDEIKSRLSVTWFDNKSQGKGWRVAKNLQSMRELWSFFPELKTNTQFLQDGKEMAAEVDRIMHHKNHFMFGDKRLREYQNRDAAFIESRGNSTGGCLVLNEPRTGKTPTIIAVMNALDKRMNIVICPSSLVLNWKKEFNKWCPKMKTFPVIGTKKQREKIYEQYGACSHNRVLIISKDTWKIEKDIHDTIFHVAIVDEAHFLRNWKSKQSEAIFKLQANIKYALTGTPSVKHGSDVYGLLHFINPDAFPSYWQFTDRYWHIEDNGWGKDVAEAREHRKEELMSIMTLNSVQRKRKEVMKWLPAQTRQTIPIQMTKKQKKYYEDMFETFEVFDESLEHGIDTINVLSQLTRLRQLCLDPRLLGFDEVGGKTTALLEFVEDNPEPFVVMTMFSSYFALIKPELEKLGKNVGVIDGSTTKPMRQKYVEWFQKGKIDILLCNIIAAGTGLTLDRADTIVFLDKSYNPADNEQAEDRIVPTTKDRLHPINIISFVAEGTVDERINDILDRKEDLTKIINKPETLKVLR